MTPIQAQSLPAILKGKDVQAQAKTGSGKTVAFGIGLLHPLDAQTYLTQALVLCPTRELADQVGKEIRRLARPIANIKILTLCGGTPIGPQRTSLERHPHIVVGTPGRILKHLQKGSLKLECLKTLVLDEADRMLDMGFISDVTALLEKTPKKRQTLLFSATISQPVKELASKLLTNHQLVSVAKQNAIAETVEHVVYPVGEHQKADLFVELIEQHNWFKVLVFTSTKAQADTLMAKLKPVKIKTAICHGDKSQGSRRRAVADFKADKIQVLIATEVAARGLDIQGLEHVVNYNLPYLAEDYVHRIGRTGRAGNKGQAISFVSREEERSLNNIERIIGEPVKRIKVPGYSVGSRETLLNNLAAKSRPAKSNKTSRSKVIRNKARTAKTRKKKN